MNEVFYKIVQLGMDASILIFIIAVFRRLFSGLPRWFFCLLWCIVGLRLVIPVSFDSRIALIPQYSVTEYMEKYQNSGTENGESTGFMDVGSDSFTEPDVFTGTGIQEENILPAVTDTAALLEDNAGGQERLQKPKAESDAGHIHVLTAIWLAGMAAMLGYMILSYGMIGRRIAKADLLFENVYSSPGVEEPFVFGIRRPQIYLPEELEDKYRDCVLEHERSHILHKDHWWKPLGFLILSVYWFFPTVWLAWILFCCDLEGACDERVIGSLNLEERKRYSHALLACTAKKEHFSVSPVTFGGNGIKKRIHNILNYKKPSFWLSEILIVVVIVLGIGTFFRKGAENRIDVSDMEETVDSKKDTERSEEPSYMQEGNAKTQAEDTEGQGVEVGLVLAVASVLENTGTIDSYEILRGGEWDGPAFALSDATKYYWPSATVEPEEMTFSEYSDMVLECYESFGEGLECQIVFNNESGSVTKVYVIDETYAQWIVWEEDITHDGVPDRIVVNPTGAKNFIPTGEEKTIIVYSGANGEEVWSGHADIIHAGWNGYYLYHDPADGSAYLMQWRPGMWLGEAEYAYQIFYLTEEGETVTVSENVLEFSLNNPKQEDVTAISFFLQKVNDYFAASYVLIDTDNAEAFYSQAGVPVTRRYEAVEVMDQLKQALSLQTTQELLQEAVDSMQELEQSLSKP